MNIKILKDLKKDPDVKKIEVEVVKALFWAFVVFQTIAVVFVGFINETKKTISFTLDGWGDEIIKELFHFHFSESGLLIYLIIFVLFFEYFFIRDLGKEWKTNQGSLLSWFFI